MDSNLILALQEAEVDTDGAIGRFAGNSGLYEKFLYKFLDDPCFALIEQALGQNDMDNMLKAAHTLKGVAGNLGLTRLYTACSELVTRIRSNEEADAKAMYPEVEASYKQVVHVLLRFREVTG